MAPGVASVVVSVVLVACGGTRREGRGGGRSGDASTVTSTATLPVRVTGRYALAPATHTIGLVGARVFVTIDADGVAHAGALDADALDAGTLVGMPRQVEWAQDDTPAGTPALAATVAARLGPGAPPMVLDGASREELLHTGCTHVTGPRAVSWGRSRAQRREVVAFARTGAAATAQTVILADGDAPAIRLIQAADETPVALIGVAAGGAAAALDLHVGGAVALGGPLCIASNRSLWIRADRIEVRGDGIVHPSFGVIALTDGAFDRAALVAAYREALDANQLDANRQSVIHVGHDVTAATLVGVIDALLEAGEKTFVLHTLPNLQPPRPPRSPRP